MKVTVSKRVSVWLPRSLNLEEQLTANQPYFKYNIDYFKYLINLIVVKGSMDKSTSTELFHWVPLNSKILKSLISNYHLYLKYLLDNGIIECDPYFKKGETSKSYRLCSIYRSPVTKEIISKPSVARKILKHKESMSASSVKKYKYLYKWFSQLSIESTAVNSYINELERRLKTINTVVKQNKLIHKINSYRITTDLLIEKDIFFTVDGKSNRLHTNLTNIKSDFRRMLKYKGEKLVTIDLKCSQPYLSAILFNEEFYTENKNSQYINISMLNKYINNKLDKTLGENKEVIPMCVKASHASDTQGFNYVCIEDVDKYKRLVSSGRLYEFIQDKLSDRDGRQVSRDKAKKVLMTVLFSDNNDQRYNFNSNRELFKDSFPTVYELFAKMKIHDHATLALLLQKIEAIVFLDKISTRISKEFPHLPIFTIHDSICTTLGNEGNVYNIMFDELVRSIGLIPTLKMEYW